MKTLSVARLAARAVVACVILLTFEASAGTPGTIPPGEPRTLDLTAVPMTISQPGTYIVRRNWDLSASSGSGGPPGITAITILANDVVIDFQGYQIKFPEYGLGVKIKGSNVRLRDGSLRSGMYSAALRSSGLATVVDNMSIYTYLELSLAGRGSEVRDSDVDGRLTMGDDAVVERNFLTCDAGCVVFANNSRLERNRLYPVGDFVAIVRGNGNVLSDNTLQQRGGGAAFSYGISVTGNGNALLRNTVTLNDVVGAVISVDGTANTLDANVALPTGDRSAGVGIAFRQGGNFFGNNRMWAQTPYDVGGLPQTDWGGNVGF